MFSTVACLVAVVVVVVVVVFFLALLVGIQAHATGEYCVRFPRLNNYSGFALLLN